MGINLILCGYHWTGCRVLEHLLTRSDIGNLAIYTHEAPPQVPSVAAIAKSHHVACSLEDVSKSALPFKPDIIASVYYRNIIRPHRIADCEGRIFNMHPSLLPRHRGCSSIPWALIDGDATTGVTFHYIDQGIDTGNILLQVSIPIANTDTQYSLFEHCMEVGVQSWPTAFELIRRGDAGTRQEGASSYHKRGAPYDGKIDPSWPADKIERFIRAMNFPPYPYATYQGTEIQTFERYQNLRENRILEEPKSTSA
jgi:methionyl-tRNA formyltransferase